MQTSAVTDQLPRYQTIMRIVLALLLVWLVTIGADCNGGGGGTTDPTGTGHESRIVVSLNGTHHETVTAYVNGESIGDVSTGGTVSSKVLQPGNYTVTIRNFEDKAIWPAHPVELKANQNAVVGFSTEPATIRVTLDALCAGTINQANVYVRDVNAGSILPGGIVTKQVTPGEYKVDIREGQNVRASQQVKVKSYGATYTTSFNCD
jgi:hypothetical protein